MSSENTQKDNELSKNGIITLTGSTVVGVMGILGDLFLFALTPNQ